jgi:hypothetical protein
LDDSPDANQSDLKDSIQQDSSVSEEKMQGVTTVESNSD